MTKSPLFSAGGKKDEGSVVADGLTMDILENEELLTAHGWRSHNLHKTQSKMDKEIKQKRP